MKQLIIAGSILLTSWLFLTGIYMPHSFIMSLADASFINTILRAVAIVALVAILFSRPPRSMVFRTVLGVISSSVLVAAFVSMADFHIGILDALVYLEVSIIFALEALEYNYALAPQTQARIKISKS